MTAPDAAFWIVEPGRGEIRAERVPAPSADEVVVRTLFSGVSRGTEALVFAGAVPEKERERMRAPFQAGRFPAPVKYGYAISGRVVVAYVQDVLVPGLQTDAKIGQPVDIYADFLAFQVNADRSRNAPIMFVSRFEPR